MDLLDRIKFDAPSDDVLAWKYPSNELRVGSQLIVNQSQEAVFVKGGTIVGIFGPGTHTLSSGNLPFIGQITKFPFAGRTPFSAEIWFINKIAKRDLKWGTKGGIQVMDPVYKYPITIRAFGQYGIRIDDASSFVSQIIGTLHLLDAEKILIYFLGEILQKVSEILAAYLADHNVSILQISAKLSALSNAIAEEISSEFKRFGLEVVNFNIERISIPQEEQNKFQEIFGKRMEIEQISGIQVGSAYTTTRTLDILEKAAANGGGAMGALLGAGLGVGVGMGVGVPLGKQVGQSMNVETPEGRLQRLRQMLESGLISAEDFAEKKKKILDEL